MKRRRPGASAAKANGRTAAAREEKLSLGQLDRHLGYFLRRLQIWVFQNFIQKLDTLKVRPAQYSVLLIIEANPSRSQAAIGQTLGIERARLSRLLQELERRKWIARVTSCSDARSRCLHLTVDGEKALAKMKRLAEQHEALLADHLGHKRYTQLMDPLREFSRPKKVRLLHTHQAARCAPRAAPAPKPGCG
jgi:DNA-binding MarR family transcriptional regulator